jgi:hypothetical protein
VHLLPVAAVLAAWQPLPAILEKGYSAVEGVRAGPLAVFVAGAAYDTTTVKARAIDVRTGAWRRLPAVPLHSRAGQAAAYDPRRDRWRLLGRVPLVHRYGFTAVWDGARLLIWGGARVDCGDCFLADGVAYSPRRHCWRRLPRSPLAPRDRHAAVPIRGGMVVWAGWGRRPYADGAILR